PPLFALLADLCCAVFFKVTPPPGSSSLSLHDALPISGGKRLPCVSYRLIDFGHGRHGDVAGDLPRRRIEYFEGAIIRSHGRSARSEEHTSELQSLTNLVCPLFLSKKNKKQSSKHHHHH